MSSSTIARGARRSAVTLDTAAEISLPLAAIAIAIASSVSLAFEVLLTRLFSILFEYHFVFVATSLAIAGLGIGGAVGAWQLGKPARQQTFLRPGRILTALAIALTVDSLIYTLLPWAGIVYIHALLALPPFILVGLLVSSLFAARPAESARLYASDLLGAAVGTVAVLGLIVWAGVFTAIFWLALVAMIPALALSYRKQDKQAVQAGGVTAAIIALLLVSTQLLGFPKFNPASIAGAPPDKTMIGVLQNSSLGAHIAETVWGPFARLDLVETNDPDTKLLFTDGGAGAYMIRFDGDFSKVADLKEEPDYLPFAMAPTTDTLILGSGAGKDVLLSLMAGSKTTTAVELNQDIVDMTRRYGSFNGNILDRPGVTTVVDDGRSFIERSQQQYDLIYMNLVYSQAAGQEGSALAESYVFTTEALKSYYEHLKPGGRIGIVTHNGYEASKVLLTAIKALEETGLVQRSALDRVFAHQLANNDPDTSTGVVVITRNTYDEDQISSYLKISEALNLKELYIPILFELPLKDLTKGIATIDTFAHNGDFNLAPTSDDQPYFYQLTWGLPDQITDLLIVAVFAVVIYGIFAARSRSKSGRMQAGSWVLFFGLLGAAYMLATLPLTQRFYLLLGNPTAALVVTLEGVLFGAGLGSLLSSRVRVGLVKTVALSLIGIVALVLAYALLYPYVRDSLLQAALPLRIVAMLAMTLPLGFLIGIPFPSGMRLAGEAMPRAVPVLWGLNAMAAVLGSVIALAVSMLLGFQYVMILGAVFYAVAALILLYTNRKAPQASAAS